MGQPDSNHGGDRGKDWPPGEAEFPTRIHIPEHELLCCIGRGSYGQVWLARNAVGAFRAVKIVFRNSFSNERPFLRELSGMQKFEPVSRLHEGFVDVLQVGINESGGYFYYIMEVADDQVTGRDIRPDDYHPNNLATEIARRGRLPLSDCLQLGLALTRAVAELHKNGLVHRDIKPGNIIFVDGMPKLGDIGLVTGVDDTLSFVGTAGFMAPEGPGRPPADLYSLGMVLYETCTGKDRHEFPVIPEEWESPDYEGLFELNEVILQACKDNPAERYRSAWDMHADLLVVLNGKSVKRLKQLEKRMAWLKHTAAVAAVAFMIAGLAGFALYREWDAHRQEHQRQISADVAYGNRAMERGDLLGALPYFAEALQLDSGNPAGERNDRLRLGSILRAVPRLTHLWFEPMKVKDAEFSPDGQSVLVARYFGNAVLCDLNHSQLRSRPFAQEPGLRSAVFSPDGRQILTTTEAGKAIVWDAITFHPLLFLPHTNKVYTGKFNPDGSRIITACNDGFARIWNARDGQLELLLAGHTKTIAAVRFSHDGRLALTASHDWTARIWNANDGRALTALPHSSWVNDAAFSPDDARVVTACDDHRARIWDVASGTRILPDLVHDDAVESAEFSPDGRLIVTASYDGTVRLWRASDHQPVSSNPILRHGERVLHVTFSADARRLLSSCNDGTVRIWDLAGAAVPPPAQHRQYSADGSRFLETEPAFRVGLTTNAAGSAIPFQPRPPVESARLSADGRFVLTSSAQFTGGQTNHLLQVWAADSGQSMGAGVLAPPPFTGAAISASGRLLAVYGGSQLQTYSTQTAALASPVVNVLEPIDLALFSPAEDLVVTICGTNVQARNAASGRLSGPALNLPVPVVYAEFSPDGRYLVTCSADPSLTKCFARIWDPRSGQPVGAPLWHGDGVLSASFCPEGNRIVTASEDFSAKVWDVNTGRQIGLPLRHTAQVEAAAWSPDGEWVATASIDQTARVWDSATGDPLTPPLNHSVKLWDVRFLPDARQIVAGDGRGRVRVWDLPVDGRPVTDLEAMAAILFGGDFISPVLPPARSAEPLSKTWERVRRHYPGDFNVTPQDIARWHQFQAENSESEQDWRGAEFHLACLVKLRPGDVELARRLAAVRGHRHSAE